MATIQLETHIRAPIGRCFDLCRSIEMHEDTTGKTGEKAVSGRTSGLIEAAESVTWEAVHFFIRQRLTVRITEMERPYYFRDEMLKGAFKSMWHEHIFEEKNGQTLMTDTFCYVTPAGILGKLFDVLVLKRYIRLS